MRKAFLQEQHREGVRLFKSIEMLADQGMGSAAITAEPSAPASAFSGPIIEKIWPGLLTGKMEQWREYLAQIDWVPDLGRNIGSFTWFRGLATLVLLCGFALSLFPEFGPISGHSKAALTGLHADRARSQMITPLAYGADTGIRMAATDAVRPLAQSPERPYVELIATLGQGDSLRRVLQRAGIADSEAGEVTNLISEAISLDEIKPGTKIDVTLGRRASQNQPRPLDQMAFRARFDLNLEIQRSGGQLKLNRQPIMVDNTPLRVKGVVGTSLYRSARAAGAPAGAVQKFLQVIGKKMSVSRDIRATDEFDIILDYRRAETGEVEVGDLLYAGIERDGKMKAQMLKWTSGGRSNWFEASGVGQSRGELVRPTRGRLTSRYGMRRHPILRYKRMHSGMDFGGGYGSPIYAVTDGTVAYAGRKGGYGKYVKLKHSGSLASGYAHMSRIAVRNGTRVRKGQIIGYIGSTGLSTGPHLHYELYRNGRTINPNSVKFVERAALNGKELARFKDELQRLRNVTPGAALGSLKSASNNQEPQREINRIEKTSIS
ncbi:M23 family metallopeptidase [Parasphingorhabdus sp. JC815]|uniref:M23 family metallopeptidase n=1 Tax=Parasphingorhabdus sp. JC815 TaxID=3232140 RepID=UPI00345754D7